MIYISKTLFTNGKSLNHKILNCMLFKSSVKNFTLSTRNNVLNATKNTQQTSLTRLWTRSFGGFGKSSKKSTPKDAPKVKINPNEFKKILSLAKPHKLKLAG